ncbi:hypothetical protein GGD38_003589 [Chitinophagaceae bacterium OAS944]|nr:hypothetical protein [Chitinophagaceae bacterium OAS944]
MLKHYALNFQENGRKTIVMPVNGLWLSDAKMPKNDIDFYSIIL